MSGQKWTKNTINVEEIHYRLSHDSILELENFFKIMPQVEYIDQVQIDETLFKNLKKDINKMREFVDDRQKMVILDASKFATPIETECIQWIVSNLLGETIVQNEEGRHLIHIYDRDPNRRIKDGARYHQTHESGAIHTDNVNIPENYQYLLVGCAMPAKIGGENIIVCGRAVYDYLVDHSPKELEILKQNFIFEYRGLSKELYRAPIISINEQGEPLFRHLRTYMESAHLRANEPLSEDQVRALDTLDAILAMSEFQLLYRLKTGEILIVNDSQILHDRRTFVDHEESMTLNDFKNNPTSQKPIKRTLLRT
jgi:hypothetical protein